MKKLMIAAAIVCAAAMSQAASIAWSSANVLVDGSGTTITAPESGSIWLVALTDTTGWDAGTWSAASGAATVKELQEAEIGTSGRSKGKVATDFMFSYEAGTLKNNDVLAVVFKADDGSYSQLQYYSDGSAVTDAKMTISGLDNNMYAGTLEFASGGKFTTAVPEPTSGLLLLLGVAGLALRRRRA